MVGEIDGANVTDDDHRKFGRCVELHRNHRHEYDERDLLIEGHVHRRRQRVFQLRAYTFDHERAVDGHGHVIVVNDHELYGESHRGHWREPDGYCAVLRDRVSERGQRDGERDRDTSLFSGHTWWRARERWRDDQRQ